MNFDMCVFGMDTGVQIVVHRHQSVHKDIISYVQADHEKRSCTHLRRRVNEENSGTNDDMVN